MIRSALLATALLLSGGSVYAAPVIGNLEQYDPAVHSDCGFFLRDDQGKLVFYANTHYDAFVQADRQVLQLQHTHTENHQLSTGRVQTGDTFSTTFVGDTARVRVDMKVTKGCEKTGAVCPRVDESGTLELGTRAGRTRLAVHGGEYCEDKN